MSNYPPTPSFGGAFSYTQQWPPPPFSTPPIPAIPLHPFSGPTDVPGRSLAQTGPAVGNPSDYRNMANFNVNTRIPGLGAHGTLPPPPPSFPYVNQFPTPQIPPPAFHSLPVPPMGLPPLPQTTAHIHPPPASAYQISAPSRINPAVDVREDEDRATSNGLDDIDREEGELSDGDGRVSSQSGPSPAQRLMGDSQTFVGTRERMSNGLVMRSEPSSGFVTPRDSRRHDISNDSSDRMDYELTNVPSPADRSPRREETGSPYHPPVSISLEPNMQDNIPPTTTTQATASSEEPSSKIIATKNINSRSTYSAGKSPAQLRVLAQGALLGLAPHNIRYNELVSEGINPSILKQLYEEVGIRVPTGLVEQKLAADTSKPSTPMVIALPPSITSDLKGAGVAVADLKQPARDSETKKVEIKQQRISGPAESKVAAKNTVVPPSSAASETGTGKPLERKEVIARMLAAKAGKLASLSSSSKAQVEKNAAVSNASVSKPLTPVQIAAPGETQVKEKNRAQTELARQRMEQLKKQGLIRSQQRSKPETVLSGATQQHQATVGTPAQSSQNVATASKIQHPLPNRPPEPESSVPARIPGLFMTSSEQSLLVEPSSTPKTTGEIAVSQGGNTHRKRPRASDFDGLGTPPKKPLSQESLTAYPEDRLIIDISDDEDLYGDNDENDMTSTGKSQHRRVLEATLANSESRGFGLSAEFPGKSGIQSHQRTAASSASQTPLKIGDQEELRLRDLQIQEMRRKIAELEERKRAKLAASRAQSPPILNRAATISLSTTPVLQPSTHGDISASLKRPQDHPTVQENLVSTMGARGSASPALHRSPSVSTLSSMDPTQLERMRSKFRRKKEIESGLPALDAELSKSEARLAEFRKEEERLLAEIAKGREGRRQLIEELESLGVETEGLSLEELQAAKATLEERERSTEFEASIEGPSSTNISSAQNVEGAVPTTTSVEPEPPLRVDLTPTTSIANAPASVPQTSQEAIELTMAAPAEDFNRDVVDEEGVGVSEGASCSSSGSAMDESVDSLQSMSIEQPRLDESPSAPPELPPDSSEAPHVLESVELETDSQTGAHVLPQRPPTPQDHDALNELTPDKTMLNLEGVQTSREPSVVSDVYEPPEPEPNPDSANTVYTPPFSPPPPGPMELEKIPVPHPTPETGKELTEKVQRPRPLDEPQIEILQGERGSQELEHHFVPYVSPLRYFKAYRYHPNFTQDVSEGYRSLTYSHNIDPMKMICPYETAGGVCNDHSCEHQHFRDMSQSDDKILVQMGSQREGKTPEEKDSYIAGLKQIINDMRRDKVKDFNTVATEIAAYRRRFLQDSSRILPL